MSAIITASRQFGSKARVALDLCRLLPDNATIWIEVFAGTAAVTLAKIPHPVEHLNDLNGDVVNLFRVLRNDSDRRRLLELIDLTPYAQEEFQACKDVVWSTDAEAFLDPVERAREFLVASWQSFGGKQHRRASWRLDKGRSGLTKTWNGLSGRLEWVAKRLKHCHLHRRHVFELIDMFGDRSDVLMFLDPPYPRHTLNGHETMYAVDMTDDEHLMLAQKLRQVKCRVLMTMAQETVYSDVLSEWSHTPFGVRSLTNSSQQEVAISNYRPGGSLFHGEATL